MIFQAADKKGRTQVYLGLEIEPGDIRTFPEDTWDRLGKPLPWLQEQIDDALYGSKKKSARPSTKKQDADEGVRTGADPMM